MNKKLIILDASAFKESSCLLRLYNNTVEGYTSANQTNDVEFGTAFHKFRAIYREKGKEGFPEACHEAIDYYEKKPMVIKKNKDYLTTAYLQSAMLKYALKYENDLIKTVRVAGEDGIEIALLEANCQFAFPYYVDNEVEVLLAGTIDEICKHNNGIYCICDCKTSSIWNIKDYFESYRLSPQLLFYVWVLKKYAEKHPASIFADMCRYPIGCFIDGVFHGGTKELILERSEVILFDEQTLSDFDKLVNTTVLNLVYHIKNNEVPLRQGLLNGACATVYGPCKYSVSCKQEGRANQQMILDSFFTKKQYNPLDFGGTKV